MFHLSKTKAFGFSAVSSEAKRSSSAASFIKNDILHFEDQNHHLYLQPMYP
jgi:hypothetical protein